MYHLWEKVDIASAGGYHLFWFGVELNFTSGAIMITDVFFAVAVDEIDGDSFKLIDVCGVKASRELLQAVVERYAKANLCSIVYACHTAVIKGSSVAIVGDVQTWMKLPVRLRKEIERTVSLVGYQLLGALNSQALARFKIVLN